MTAPPSPPVWDSLIAAGPLLWLALTLGAYQIGTALHRRAAGHPLVNPVLVAVALLIGVLMATGTGYPVYFAGARPIHLLLGPATVALAVPLAVNIGRVRRALAPLAAALLAGAVTGIASAVGLGRLFGIAPDLLATLAPKSVTTPIAMAVSEPLGGIPALTAAVVIATGILGAVIGPPLLHRLGLREPLATGTAIGTAAHGVGTARAFQIDPLVGTFSGLAMALNGLLTALLAPFLVPWMMPS